MTVHRMQQPEWRIGAPGTFAHDLVRGLQAQPRSVPPKYFYDRIGSELFDRICELPEYYPTRTEAALLQRHGHEMAECIGGNADIIEFGAGSLLKIRLLLKALQAMRLAPARFIPVDISAEHLQAQALTLAEAFPTLTLTPIAADFTQGLSWPPSPPAGAGFRSQAARRVGFFPGSSIGNFNPEEASTFLRQAAALLRGGGLLIGVDLVKDPALLHRAYNDAQGVTAAFNKNLLARANRELGADFDLDRFDHYAFYDPVRQRIEMHLVSACRQSVAVCGQRVEFDIGQTLHTESSFKYTIDSFQRLARGAGFAPGPHWCDGDGLFSVHWLQAPAA